MTLKDLCLLLTDGNWIESKDQSPNGIRLIQTGNVGNGTYLEKGERAKFISEETFARLGCTEIFPGDILVSRLPDPVGRACLVPMKSEKMITAVDCSILRANQEIVKKRYLLHFLKSPAYFNQLSNKLAGTTRVRISRKNLEQVQVTIPGKETQQHIADTLDRVETVVNSRKQQLSALDALIKARFVEMFGDVISNSKGWKKHRLDEVATSRLGKMLDAKQQKGMHPFPYLANFNVQWFDFVTDNLNIMDFDEADQKEFHLEYGDLLVCEGGEIGRCAVWRDELQPCYFQKALHRVRCNQQVILPDYLSWWFKFNCENGGFESIAGAKVTIAHLPGVKLKALSVAIPPIELQNQFSTLVSQVNQSKAAVQKALDEAQLLFDSLMQKYFG